MKPRLLLIDNYDSFTYNLVQAFLALGADVHVRLNDCISVGEAVAARPTHLVVSPGPGRPENAGVSGTVIRALMERIPVLGVCLGHQALVGALGGDVVAARRLMHGKSSPVRHDGRTLYRGLPNPFEAGRYHSLAVDEASLPPELTVCARTTDGEIMGVHHAEHPTYGVQFHPESVLTPSGKRLLRNFLQIVESSK